MDTEPDRLSTLVALAAVIALGLSAGAMLAEGAVLVPYWRSLPADDFLAWYAANAARLFNFYGPLEIASTVLAIVAAGLYHWRKLPGAGLWFVAALLVVAVLLAFPLYFRDANASFAAATIARTELAGELARWTAWHWGRTAIGVGAFAAALLAVRQRGANA